MDTRREFVKKAATSSLGLITLPTIISASVKGANDKINVGFIGTGTHGIRWNLRNYLALDNCRVVAVCDVDSQRMQEAKAAINEKYNDTHLMLFDDFREMLERKDIDAIQITTPDHWHVYMSIAALKAGKHVCCEKPTLTIEQGRILVNEINKQDKLFQTSMEDRWLKNYYKLVKLVREGRIGQLKKMRVGLPGNNVIRFSTDQTTQQPPEYFNYDMWLGPAPVAPYSPARCHFNFRWIFDYSAGSIADWGAHLIDTAQLCNFSEKSGPVSVEGAGIQPTEGIFNTFEKYRLNYVYGNGVEMEVHGFSIELYCEGSDGWIHAKGWNKGLEASNPELLELTEDDETRAAGHLNEHDNFLKCIRNGGIPAHPAEDMHRTASVAHIGNAAMLLNRKLQWDPHSEAFVGDEEANKLRYKAERDPWTLEQLINS